MFQIYVNDMQCGVTSYVNLFADYAKLMRVVKNTDDCQELKGDINKIDEWNMRWKLDLSDSLFSTYLTFFISVKLMAVFSNTHFSP